VPRRSTSTGAGGASRSYGQRLGAGPACRRAGRPTRPGTGSGIRASGWTWLDDAPLGLGRPYHHGRWGLRRPVLGRGPPARCWCGPVYSPPPDPWSFLGGPVVVGRPGLLGSPLGWGRAGDPLVGRARAFVGRGLVGRLGRGRAWSTNVVIARTATVKRPPTSTVYHNVSVTNAVVGVPARPLRSNPASGAARLTDAAEVRQARPRVRGRARRRGPVAASPHTAARRRGPAALPLGVAPRGGAPPRCGRGRTRAAPAGLLAGAAGRGPWPPRALAPPTGNRSPQQRIVPAGPLLHRDLPAGRAGRKAGANRAPTGGAGRAASEDGPRVASEAAAGRSAGAGPARAAGRLRRARKRRPVRSRRWPPAPPRPRRPERPRGPARPRRGQADPKALRQPAEHPGARRGTGAPAATPELGRGRSRGGWRAGGGGAERRVAAGAARSAAENPLGGAARGQRMPAGAHEALHETCRWKSRNATSSGPEVIKVAAVMIDQSTPPDSTEENNL